MRRFRQINTLFVVSVLLVVYAAPLPAKEKASGINVKMIESPAAVGSKCPHLETGADGHIYMSWVEPGKEKKHTLRYARWKTGKWSEPVTIAEGDDWFVNWADVPSITVAKDGRMIAHWLQKSGPDTYAYDVRVSQTTDGKIWSESMVPHRDGTQTEHGFVSIVPLYNGNWLLAWLDGRKFANAEDGEGEMTLRSAELTPSGELLHEQVVDDRVCDCCPTDMVNFMYRTTLVYRDRSPEELRDIQLVSYENGKWTNGFELPHSGWKIEGCPVNGAAISANGKTKAWFTMGGGTAAVYTMYRSKHGVTDVSRVDDGNPIGRVDAVMAPGGRAIVSWIELVGDAAELRVAKTTSQREISRATITQMQSARASGFPKMVLDGDHLLLAWTDPDDGSRVRTAWTDIPK